MRIKLQELLQDNYKDIIEGPVPPQGPDGIRITHDTTDQAVKATRASVRPGFPGSFGFGGGFMYERCLSEAELPYNDEADKMSDNPEEFKKFLDGKGAGDSFDSYFTKNDIKENLKEDARNKAIKMAEDIINKRKASIDLINKKPLPDIETIKENDELLFSKLDKIVDYIQKNMSVEEKIVIDSYFKSKIHAE